MAVVGDATVVVRAVTSSVSRDIQRGFNGTDRVGATAGQRIGRAFSRGFNSNIDGGTFKRITSGLAQVANASQGSYAAFVRLARVGRTLGTALGAAVGGIGAVIGGLGALAGAAGGAIASVASLGNALFALGSGLAVAKLALGGIGKAVSALNKPAGGGGGGGAGAAAAKAAARAREAAAGRVTDAEEALALVIERNREDLVDANNDVRDAQLALNEALEAGREEIQQLGFDAEDAALSEKRASIELNKARETLARVQDLPPNSRARQEAELAYREADLNLRRAKDRSADLNAEQAKLATTGVAGTEGVIDATNALAQAEANRAKTVRDALRSEVSANKDLADARKDATTAGEDSGGASGGGGGADPYAGLNDAQRKFADFINGLKPKFDELKRIAAEGFLPPLQEAIQKLVDSAFPTIATGVGIIAAAMGVAVNYLADAIITTENLSKLAGLFESSGRLIELFGKTAGSAYGVLLSILTATAPVAERFFSFLSDRLATLDSFYNGPGNAGLLDFFSRAADAASDFGEIFGNIFEGFGDIINANLGPGTGGQLLLDWLKEATEGFSQIGAGDKLGPLQGQFVALATNAKSVFQAIGAFLGILLEVGQNKAIAETFDVLKGGAPLLKDIVTAGIEAGPSLANLVINILEIGKALADSGAAIVFFDTLNTIASAVSDVLQNGVVQAILDVGGRILAFGSAIGVVVGLVTTGFGIVTASIFNVITPIVGVIGSVGSLVAAVGPAFSGILGSIEGVKLGFDILAESPNGFTANLGRMGSSAVGSFAAVRVGLASVGRVIAGVLLGPVGIAIGVIALLVGAFIALYNTNAEFKAQMDAIWADLSAVFAKAGSDILTALQPLIPVFTDLINTVVSALVPVVVLLAETFAQILTAVAPLVALLVGGLAEALAEILTAVVSLVAQLLGALVPAFVQILEAVIPLVTTLISALLPVFTAIIDAVLPLITVLIGALLPVFTAIIGAVVPLITVLLDLLIPVFTAIVGAIVPVITTILDILVPVLTFLLGIITGVVTFITSPTGISSIGDVFDTVFTFISDVVTNVSNFITTTISAFVIGIQIVWNATWQAIGDFFSTIWQAIVDGVTGYINLVLTVITTVIAVIVSTWNAVWQGIGDFFKGVWDLIVSGVKIYIDTVKTVIKTVTDTISSIWNTVWSGIGTFFGGIWNGIVSAVQGFKSVFEGAFGGIKSFVDTAFSGVLGAVKGPINGIISLVNGAIRSLNGLKVTIPDFVPGLGGKTFGLNLPTIPSLASGGIALPTTGGTLVQVAEAGRAERIEPLDDSGLSKRDRALIDIMTGGGSGATFNIYATPGMDIQELAAEIDRIMRSKSRKGSV